MSAHIAGTPGTREEVTLGGRKVQAGGSLYPEGPPVSKDKVSVRSHQVHRPSIQG